MRKGGFPIRLLHRLQCMQSCLQRKVLCGRVLQLKDQLHTTHVLQGVGPACWTGSGQSRKCFCTGGSAVTFGGLWGTTLGAQQGKIAFTWNTRYPEIMTASETVVDRTYLHWSPNCGLCDIVLRRPFLSNRENDPRPRVFLSKQDTVHCGYKCHSNVTAC